MAPGSNKKLPYCTVKQAVAFDDTNACPLLPFLFRHPASIPSSKSHRVLYPVRISNTVVRTLIQDKKEREVPK